MKHKIVIQNPPIRFQSSSCIYSTRAAGLAGTAAQNSIRSREDMVWRRRDDDPFMVDQRQVLRDVQL